MDSQALLSRLRALGANFATVNHLLINALNRLTLTSPLSQAAWKNRYLLYAERGGLSGFAPATKTFTNVTGTTPEPANRMSPALAYSTKAGALVMFGGQGGTDTWAFDVKSKRWTQMPSSTGATPPGLSQLAGSMVYDSDWKV